MELICPDCRADLVVADAQTATCAGHDGRYQVLFNRELGQAQPGTEAVEPTIRIGDSQIPKPQPPAIRCRQHPEVVAVARCRVCNGGVCATCDFLLPGNLHVCPSCIDTEQPAEIKPRRRNLAIGGILLGVVSLLVYGSIITGAWARAIGGGEASAMILGNLMLWPPVAGLAMSLTAFDRNLRNGPLIWIPLVWNGIFAAISMLFMIIGIFK